jgi:membrane-associated HD superfamily phosphohydrolase
MRTLKKIEETVRTTQEIQEAQRKAQERLDARSHLTNTRTRQLRAARDNINKLRTERSKGRQLQRDLILHSKQQDFSEGRKFRLLSLKTRHEFQTTKTQENRMKSSLIKWEEQRAAESYQLFQEQRLKQSKDNYLKKIEDEGLKKETTERRIVEMEKVELELISRLQNTQNLHQEAFQRLEQAISTIRRSQSQPELKGEVKLSRVESDY